MFKLSVTDIFSAAHRLCGYQGACSELHGHNWTVRVGVRASETDEIGLALDFGVIKAKLREVLAEFDHTYLNDHPAFVAGNPSSENLARYIFERLAAALDNNRASVCEVEVCESGISGVVYTNA